MFFYQRYPCWPLTRLEIFAIKAPILLLLALLTAPKLAIAAEAAPLTLPDLSISAEWLQRHQNHPDLLILDARLQKRYNMFHIKNAISLPAIKTYGEAPKAHLLISMNVAQKRFSAAGIRENKTIIIYDNGEAISAARVFWALQVYGLPSVAILDGGMPAWLEANGSLSNQTPTVKPSHFIPQISPKELTTKLRVRMGIERPDTVLIDVRKREEYEGKESLSRRFGHIPGAVSVPWTENFTEINGVKLLKSKSELAKLYQPILGKASHTTTYCNLGQHAALTYLVLRRLGHNVSAYDGSWHEWGNDHQLPIVGPKNNSGKPSTGVKTP